MQNKKQGTHLYLAGQNDLARNITAQLDSIGTQDSMSCVFLCKGVKNMTKHQFSRNELAIGKEGLDLLKSKTVVVLGVGGVGSFAAEALARTNIGHIILIDKDDVDITNVNRQLHALTTTIGQSKVDLMEERIRLINPDCKVTSLHMFYTEEIRGRQGDHRVLSKALCHDPFCFLSQFFHILFPSCYKIVP